ncbi:MAG: hypothetical protein WBA58_04025 [Giesbergeria sp.]
MGIALLAAATLTHPLTALHRWWSTRRNTPGLQNLTLSNAQQPLHPLLPLHTSTSPVRLQHQGLNESLRHSTIAARKVHKPSARPLRPLPRTSDAHAPLRVLRSHTSACGRMAISGRMADVCAELDRLAASENQH